MGPDGENFLRNQAGNYQCVDYQCFAPRLHFLDELSFSKDAWIQFVGAHYRRDSEAGEIDSTHLGLRAHVVEFDQERKRSIDENCHSEKDKLIMRIQPKQTGGNVLVATMLTTTLIGLYVASYLTAVRTESLFTSRSKTWNKAIPVAEAGIEEAMSHLAVVQTNMDLLETEDWYKVNARYYMKTNWLSTNEYYVVGIFPTTPPVVVSEGFVRLPQRTNFLSRTIKIETKPNLLFPYGMLADQNVQLNGNNIMIDSFDSSDERYSTSGRYVTSKRKDNGTLVTSSSSAHDFDLGNAKVYGKIASAPGGGWDSNPNLTVGNTAWHNAGNRGVQPGAYTDDVNVSLMEVECDFDSGLIPSSTTNYLYVLGSAEYKLSAPMKFEGGNVLVTGNAKLLVTEDFDFRHTITIESNASLTLYVAARSATIGGQGIQNNTGVAQNFIYYGLPSNESFTFSGNGEFVGCIYAPNTTFTLSGGGQTEGDFSGASVTKTVVMNGQYEFHFDEQLATSNGPSNGYMATSWDEIDDTWKQILNGNKTVSQLR
jgi:hypothetical protein